MSGDSNPWEGWSCAIEHVEAVQLDVDIGTLTEHERVIASWLDTSLTFTEIANRLTAPPNTIKTQARSLYRRLGATSRQDAVQHIELTGLFTARTLG